MAQYRKTFFSLGGPTAFADPAEEERQGRQRLALEQQQISQQRAAQQQEHVLAQQDFALRESLGQRGADFRERKLGAEQAQIGQGQEYDSLQRRLRRDYETTTAETEYLREQERDDLGRTRSIEDRLAADLSNEKTYERRRGEEKEAYLLKELERDKKYARKRGENEITYQRRLKETIRLEKAKEKKEQERHDEAWNLEMGARDRQIEVDRENKRRYDEGIALKKELMGKDTELKAKDTEQGQDAQLKKDKIDFQLDLEAVRAAGSDGEQKELGDKLRRRAKAHGPELAMYVELELWQIQVENQEREAQKGVIEERWGPVIR